MRPTLSLSTHLPRHPLSRRDGIGPMHTALALVLTLLTAPLQAAPAGGGQPGCEDLPPAQAADPRLELSGDVLKAYSCVDREGEHLLIATGTPLRKAFPSAGSSEVHFYKFSQGGNGWTKRWEVRDWVTGTANAGIAVDQFEAQTIDRGESTAAYIAYRIYAAGAAPEDGKLFVFYKDKKHAVRGTVARTVEDYASRSPDAAFLTLPPAIQEHALSMWDKLSLPATRMR